MTYLNLSGVRHAPPGFHAWALEHGAVSDDQPEMPAIEPSFSQEWRTG